MASKTTAPEWAQRYQHMPALTDGGSTGVRSLSEENDLPSSSINVKLRTIFLRRRAARAHKQGLHMGWAKHGDHIFAVVMDDSMRIDGDAAGIANGKGR